MFKKNAILILGLFTSQLSIAQDSSKLFFKETTKDFPTSKKNLRKWDSPVIADLDQDGYPDVLLNDHGFSVQVMWNNQGIFSKPFDIIMGDMHGIAVGNIDSDENLELVLSRGGGSGSNARNSKLYEITKHREFLPQGDFDQPLELMRGRTVKFYDGDNDGDLDLLNFAFPGKEKNGESENYIYENDGNGQLVLKNLLPPIKKDGQKTLVFDFNSDRIQDLLIYGDGNIKIYQGDGDLGYKEVSSQISQNPISHVTGAYAFDYDNDGDLDLYLSRGLDFEIGETFFDKQKGNLGFYTKRGVFEFIVESGDILSIKNLQSQWPNKEVFLGESGYNYEFPGETHSGRDIRLVNSDCLGFPEVMDKKGTYIGYIGNRKWKISGNMWSPMTGIFEGIENYDESLHSKGPKDIFLENKGGRFVNITSQSNLDRDEHIMAVTIGDFDNNGFKDLVLIPRGQLIEGIKPIVYLNSGNRQFVELKGSGLQTLEVGSIGMAAEVIDYNKDGYLDLIIGNERGKWHLFENLSPKSAEIHFLDVEVGNSPSGDATGLDAMVQLSFKGGLTQSYVIGANGSAYSQSLNTVAHFGLGQNITEVILNVTWSNGESIEKKVTHFNQTIKLGEETNKN